MATLTTDDGQFGSRARDLPTQCRDLMAQHEDLRVLGGITASANCFREPVRGAM